MVYRNKKQQETTNAGRLGAHRVANPWALVSNLIYNIGWLYWGTIYNSVLFGWSVREWFICGYQTRVEKKSGFRE